MSYVPRRREINGNSNRSSEDSIRSGSLSKTSMLKNDGVGGYLRRPSWINDGSSSVVVSTDSSCVMKGLLHSDHGSTRLRTVGAKFSSKPSKKDIKEDQLFKYKDKRPIEPPKKSTDDNDSIDSPVSNSRSSSPPPFILESKKNNVEKNLVKSCDKKTVEKDSERTEGDEKRKSKQRSTSRSSSKPGTSSKTPRSKLVALGLGQEIEVNYESDDSGSFIKTELAAVTETLDLIRETQENILAELKVDIESLQDENSTLLKSNEMLKNENSKLQMRLMEFQFNLDKMSMEVKAVKDREERIQSSIKTRNIQEKERKRPTTEQSEGFALSKHQSRKAHRKEDHREKYEYSEELASIKKKERSIKVDEEELVCKKSNKETDPETDHRSRAKEETRKKSSTSLRESLIKLQRNRSRKGSVGKKSSVPSEEVKSWGKKRKIKKKKESNCLSFFGFRKRRNSDDEDEDTK